MMGVRSCNGIRLELHIPFDFHVETLYQLFACFTSIVLNVG